GELRRLGRVPAAARRRRGRVRPGRADPPAGRQRGAAAHRDRVAAGPRHGQAPAGDDRVLAGHHRGGRRDHGRDPAGHRGRAGDRALLRVLAAYLLFILTEYAVWIAMLVFAYHRGGTVTAGLVAVAQLVPAAVVAPVTAAVADRRSPVVLLAGGYLAQAAGMA